MRSCLAVLVLILCSCGSTQSGATALTGRVNTSVHELKVGQVVNGVPCLRDDLPATHFHIHLQILLDGKEVIVPAGLGVGRPWAENPPGFIATGGCFAWIHTHDTTGVVHVFTQIGKSDTLGQVFSVWGQPLDATGALGYKGTIAVLVNGQPIDGDPGLVPLKNLENVVIELGKPPSTEPAALYDFGTMRR